MLPTGSGKSRIIPTLGVHLLSTGLAQRVHVLIPGTGLLKRDREEYADYWKLAGFESFVEYHDTPHFATQNGHVVLVDEADHFAFTEPVAFGALMTRCPSVCFTGTSPDADLNQMEHQVLLKMGLVFHKYWPQSIETPPKPQVSKKIRVEGDQELVEHLDQLIDD